MANISQNVNIEMLEKLPDGTYKRKYPKTRADDGTTFDEHLAEKATQDKYGHIRLSDIPNPTKESIGLGNVKNVEQIPLSEKGQPNGVAPLDESGRLPTALSTPVSIVPSDEILSEFNHIFTGEGYSNTDTTIGSFRIGHGGLYRINADFQTNYHTGITYFYFDYGNIRVGTLRIDRNNGDVYINMSTDLGGLPSGATVTIKARASVSLDVRIRNLKLLGTYGTPDMEVFN